MLNLLRSFVFSFQLTAIKEAVSKMTGRDTGEVRVVVAPYRICPLGAHIDHQVGRFVYDSDRASISFVDSYHIVGVHRVELYRL